MYELIFTVVMLFPGSMATINETVLSRHSTIEDCQLMRHQVYLKLVNDTPKTPTYLDCKKSTFKGK
jgi:hypothetical protein